MRGEIPEWTGAIQPKLHHNTPEGKREAFLTRPLVEPSIVPKGPLPSREQQEEWGRKRRLEYIQRGIERGYPLLEDPHDRRIFKTPKPIDNFLPIALKHLTVAELVESVRPKYYGDIRYKPAGDYVPPIEEPEVARCSEPAPSTAAPAAADKSSEEEEEKEEVLQLAISKEEKEELTGVTAAIARSTTVGIEAAIVDPSGQARDVAYDHQRRHHQQKVSVAEYCHERRSRPWWEEAAHPTEEKSVETCN